MIKKSNRIEDVIDNEVIKEIKDEVIDTGEDVDYIKADLEHIKKNIQKEFDEQEEDIDDIKEHIEEIKDKVGELHLKAPSRLMTLRDTFGFDDFAQQIVGAIVLSAPFVVTEEVWTLASNLNLVRVLLIIGLTIFFDIMILYFAKFRKMDGMKIWHVPLRMISLIGITYVTSASILTLFGVIGGPVVGLYSAAKLVVVVGLFANIGASTADLLR